MNEAVLLKGMEKRIPQDLFTRCDFDVLDAMNSSASSIFTKHTLARSR